MKNHHKVLTMRFFCKKSENFRILKIKFLKNIFAQRGKIGMLLWGLKSIFFIFPRPKICIQVVMLNV